ncbi:MAG TPA: sulfotransferase domain-containing protein [Thermohalobaculum sp.]|nr:sulfotransferase domain-containing protein [Thermohalobaculum sp.]
MEHRRPTSLDQMVRSLQHLVTDEGVGRGLAYKPGPTDIFIAPYAKCGTTWMQQIVHGLRTGGSMDFDEITEVIPFLEVAHDMGIDIDAPQVAAPRVFKCHLAWDAVPKGGRYIVVFRDPVDAMVSMYRFFEGWFFEPGTISLAEFAGHFLGRDPRKNYWGHAASWWRQRGRDDVLAFAFEEMKRDLPGVVDRVAGFIGGAIPPQTRALATAQASFDFMKRHERQFDDHLVRQARDAACGLPPGGASSKVNQGEAGRGAAVVTQDIRDRFSERWRQTMTAEFGLDSYQDLVRALRA